MGPFSKYVIWEEEGVDEESKKKWNRKEGVYSKKVISLTQSFRFTFFCHSIFIPSWLDNITGSNKKSTSKEMLAIVSEITIRYLHKHIIILLLSQCGLFIHTFVFNKSILSKDVTFYLLWYNVRRWSSHICQKFTFLSFYSFLVKFSE